MLCQAASVLLVLMVCAAGIQELAGQLSAPFRMNVEFEKTKEKKLL